MKQEKLSEALECIEQDNYLEICIFYVLERSDRKAAMTGISILMDTIDKAKGLLDQTITQGENNDIQ